MLTMACRTPCQDSVTFRHVVFGLEPIGEAAAKARPIAVPRARQDGGNGGYTTVSLAGIRPSGTDEPRNTL